MQIHRTTARNFSTNTENRIHSDDVAARFGFERALVPGAAVFGHMTRPLVATLGVDWLAGYRAEVRFLKPAYHGDELAVVCADSPRPRSAAGGEPARGVPGGQSPLDEAVVQCHGRGVLLAELRTQRTLSEVDERAFLAGGAPVAERPAICWDNMEVDAPFPTWRWTPDAIANAEAAAQVEDDLACYQDGVLHPHAILSLANQAFTRRYRLPAWIHVGSDIRMRQLLRVGDEIEVRTVPTAKWRRKGHEFVDLYMAFLVAGEVATEIVHRSIFAIAPRI